MKFTASPLTDVATFMFHVDKRYTFEAYPGTADAYDIKKNSGVLLHFPVVWFCPKSDCELKWWEQAGT